MLKQILFLLVLSFYSICLEAQDLFKPSTHIGINAGVSMSRVAFRPTIHQDLLTSSSGGLVVRHISEPHIGIQLELNYAGKGWSEDLDSLGSYKRSLQTYNVPMQAVFIAGSKLVRLAFTLGPYVSWLREEKESFSVDTLYYKDYYERPLENKWEFGFTGGIGIEFHTKVGAFGLRAIYCNSLSNLFPLNSDTFFYNASRSQVLNAGFTYFIKL